LKREKTDGLRRCRTEELPNFIKDSIEAYIGCLSGAMIKDEYIRKVKAAGFQDVRIMDEPLSQSSLSSMIYSKSDHRNIGAASEKVREIAGSVVSMKFTAPNRQKELG